MLRRRASAPANEERAEESNLREKEIAMRHAPLEKRGCCETRIERWTAEQHVLKPRSSGM